MVRVTNAACRGQVPVHWSGCAICICNAHFGAHTTEDCRAQLSHRWTAPFYRQSRARRLPCTGCRAPRWPAQPPRPHAAPGPRMLRPPPLPARTGSGFHFYNNKESLTPRTRRQAQVRLCRRYKRLGQRSSQRCNAVRRPAPGMQAPRSVTPRSHGRLLATRRMQETFGSRTGTTHSWGRPPCFL